MEHGIEPAPQRSKRTPWKTFLKAHWDSLTAADFFTVEVLTVGGRVRYSVYFVTEWKTRRVHIAGISCQPRSPNLNAQAERLVLSIKSECPNRTVPLGENHLRSAITEFMLHYHGERHHQGLGHRLLEPDETAERSAAFGRLPGASGRHAAVRLPEGRVSTSITFLHSTGWGCWPPLGQAIRGQRFPRA